MWTEPHMIPDEENGAAGGEESLIEQKMRRHPDSFLGLPALISSGQETRSYLLQVETRRFVNLKDCGEVILFAAALGTGRICWYAGTAVLKARRDSRFRQRLPP